MAPTPKPCDCTQIRTEYVYVDRSDENALKLRIKELEAEVERLKRFNKKR